MEMICMCSELDFLREGMRIEGKVRAIATCDACDTPHHVPPRRFLGGHLGLHLLLLLFFLLGRLRSNAGSAQQQGAKHSLNGTCLHAVPAGLMRQVLCCAGGCKYPKETTVSTSKHVTS